MNTSTPKELTITLSLYRFLERYLLRSPNKDAAPPVTIDSLDAEVIRAIDKQEKYCHIQYETLAGDPLDEPRLWWINSWKTTYTRWQLDKERSARERKEANLLTENTQRLKRAMSLKYGLEEEMFDRISRKIAKQQIDKAANIYNVTIDKG